MDRPKNSQEFSSWNEEMIKRYDPDVYHTASPLPIRLIEQLRVRTVIKLLDAQPDSRVLEVGCGGGNVLEQVGGKRFGIDLSPFILEKAKKRLGPSVGIVRADALQLPFGDASFDRVYCSEVLEHVLDPIAVAREMRRVLKPAGWAVISVPNEDLINDMKQFLFRLPFARRLLGGQAATSGSDQHGTYQMSDKMDDEWHLHSFSKKQLLETVEEGFTVERIAGIPTGLLPLRYVARLRPR